MVGLRLVSCSVEMNIRPFWDPSTPRLLSFITFVRIQRCVKGCLFASILVREVFTARRGNCRLSLLFRMLKFTLRRLSVTVMYLTR